MPELEGNERIAALISRIEEQEDPREGFAICKQQIERLERAGDEVPEELVRVRKALETDLILESRGW